MIFALTGKGTVCSRVDVLMCSLRQLHYSFGVLDVDTITTRDEWITNTAPIS